ncbi:MAG: thrombospondin type 3 repeat-containing protein [Candidatus Bathyarchaeia archaeon]
MPKNKILSTAIAMILASTMFGLCGNSLVNASTTVNANPRIVYWANPIFVNGTGQGQWFFPNPDAYYITWSPSGRMLLIVVYEEDIYGPFAVMKVVAINASSMKVIHKFSAPGAICDRTLSSFAVSPDETKIFFGNRSSDRSCVDIVSVNLDGSNPTVIERVPIAPGQFYVTVVDVARDGTFLVYTEEYWYYSEEQRRDVLVSRIKKFDFATRKTTLILEFEGSIRSLKISPSNDRIAFTSNKYRLVYGYEGLYVVNLDGTNLTNVPAATNDKVALWVNWASNGTLTYTEVSNKVLMSGNPYEWAPTANLTAVDVDGRNKRTICKCFCGSPSPAEDSLVAFLQFLDVGGLRFIPCLLNRNLSITPNPDSDGDGLPDMDEFRHCLNPCNPIDIREDYDNDGLTNLEEITIGTWMFNRDSDGDGLSDGVEIKVFLTNPLKRDTDGDGVDDGHEVAATGLNAFVNVLPAGWIRMQLEWQNKRMYVSTNSSVLGVVFNSTSMALTVNVGGPDGTAGVANITVPIDMISSLSAVKVTLDNQPLDFQISQAGGYAQIYVQYHHSFHQLTAHLSGGGGGIGGVNLTGILSYWWLILSIAIVAVASVIAAIIVKRG